MTDLVIADAPAVLLYDTSLGPSLGFPSEVCVDSTRGTVLYVSLGDGDWKAPDRIKRYSDSADEAAWTLPREIDKPLRVRFAMVPGSGGVFRIGALMWPGYGYISFVHCQ